ncbi:MAG: hypothetical protein HRT88_02490, partial [Lentisphaeraceae bacterium]|nr:hypothetical protein [Lentisphaeraceae bacterium]
MIFQKSSNKKLQQVKEFTSRMRLLATRLLWAKKQEGKKVVLLVGPEAYGTEKIAHFLYNLLAEQNDDTLLIDLDFE